MESVKRELYRELETLLNHYHIFKNKYNQNQQALLNYESFTNREKEIVGLIAHGLSTQQIADDLFISKSTVMTHLRSIYEKAYLEINPDKRAPETVRIKLILFYLKHIGVLDSNWYIDL